MINMILVIILGFLGLLTTLIGLLKDRDRRFKKKWWKQLKKEDKAIAIIGVCILGFSICQYCISEKEKKNEKIQAERDKRTADSILKSQITAGVDSNRKALFKDLSEALEKQMLKLDTFNNELISLKDTVNKGYPGIEPTLYILKNGIRIAPKANSSVGYDMTVDITALDGDLTNFDIKANFICYCNNKLYYPVIPLDKQYIVVKNTSQTLNLSSDLPVPNTIMILIKGFFTTKQRPLKKYYVERVFRYLGGTANLTYETYGGEKSLTLQLFKEKPSDGQTKAKGNFYDKKRQLWIWR